MYIKYKSTIQYGKSYYSSDSIWKLLEKLYSMDISFDRPSTFEIVNLNVIFLELYSDRYI